MLLKPCLRLVLSRPLALGLILFSCVPLAATARTLTAKDGRAIEAEVVGFEGLDKVRIKRADTGQTYTLPIATFGEADQKALGAEATEAASKPTVLRDGDIVVELSRLRFDSRKTSEDARLTSGGVIRDAIVTTDQDWGYTLTLKNTTNKPIANLRAEYLLYVKVDALKTIGAEPTIRRKSFSLAFDPVPANGRVSARSDAVTTRKVELKPGVSWVGTNDTKTRDTLHGIWLRIYQGDQLVLETALPANLATTGKWPAAGAAAE